MPSISNRLRHAWDAFTNQGLDTSEPFHGGGIYGSRPDRRRVTVTNERSIISSIYTRISIDVADAPIRHVRTDEDDRFLDEIPSKLNECLKVEANIDQGPRHFRQDIAMTLLDLGVVAIVPVRTTLHPKNPGSYDVLELRVGEIVGWMPQHVRVNVYNQETGMREQLVLPKTFVAIVENPLYAVMNEPNSTLQRLIRKLNLLDAIDEQSSSGKLDMIIQLPYVIKSEARRQQAEQRRKDIEFQMSGSKYGIAYTDATEKITQLNRPTENNLLKQVTYLTEMLYSQLGLTEEVMNGTADQAAMLNYRNRTVKPILDAVAEAMRRTMLTKTGRAQHQSIMWFSDPFALVPIEVMSEIADKFTRNEIASSNEIRQAIGMKPSKDKKADELRNSNMPRSDSIDAAVDKKIEDSSKPKSSRRSSKTVDPNQEEGDIQNGS